MNYLIIPGINVIISVALMCDPSIDLRGETGESYILFFTVVCFLRIIEYFTLIRRSVLLDAKIYLESKNALENKTAEDLERDLSKINT